MSTRAPLTVRLSTPDSQQAFDVRDVEYSRSWRGGFKDASVTLSAPLDRRHPMLSPFARMRIDDNRSARTVWEGYLDIPGKARGDSGDVWQIGATGGYARLADRRKQYIVIDRHFDGWDFGRKTQGGMSASQGSHPDNDDIDALVLEWNDGIAIANGAQVSMRYSRFNDAGQFIGGFGLTHDDGSNVTDNRFQFCVTRKDVDGTFEIARNRALSTTPDSTGGSAGSEWSNFRDIAVMRRWRDSGGATNVGSGAWSAVTTIWVRALRHDIDGNWISGANSYADDFVLCHDVVVDMLTFFKPPIDKASASIDDTFANHIDHMAYSDPTTMQDVLDDLALMHPTMCWEVLETTASSGRNHRFNLRKLDTSPRYLATTDDGWDAPGGESELNNEVVVSWRDRKNQRTSKSYTTAVPELDQWGITRDAELINLEDDLGITANADRVGTQVLAQVSMPPEAGTLTVARPIRDLWTGRDVWPWEVEAGYRVLIQDVDMSPQPITEVAYRDSDGSAALTVGEPVLSTDEIVNIFAKRRRRRR